MRVTRFYKNCVLASIFLLFSFIALHHYSNIVGLVLFFFFHESSSLPLTLHCNQGRLGNQMCTYATLYGLSALNRRSFVSLSCNTKHLEEIFVGPAKAQSVYSSLYFRSNPWNLLSYLKPEDTAIPSNSNFLQGYKYPCSYTFFDHVKDEIRREFQFQDHLKQHAQAMLQKANVHNFSSPTYVGVHVRRGDYDERWLKVFEGVPVNMEYFEKALKYFRDKYKNVIFVAVSEDRPWCIKNLSLEFGVHVPEQAPSAEHDLALLANCNHTILTYGTFGFWGAYLAGGEVIYFNKFLKPNTTFTLKKFVFDKMYPPHWKGIVTVKPSYWLKNKENKNSVKPAKKHERNDTRKS